MKSIVGEQWDKIRTAYVTRKQEKLDATKHAQILEIILQEMPGHINRKKLMDGAQKATDRIMEVL